MANSKKDDAFDALFDGLPDLIELIQHADIVKKAVDIKSQCVKLRSKTVFDNAAKRAQARDDKRKEQRAILREQLKQRQTYRINTSDIDDDAIEA